MLNGVLTFYGGAISMPTSSFWRYLGVVGKTLASLITVKGNTATSKVIKFV